MSRRHLTFVVVAVASLVVGACASPTAPSAASAHGPRFDGLADSSATIIGTMGSF
jgi:hypothetical protein